MSNSSERPTFRFTRTIQWILMLVVALFVIVTVLGQSLWFWLNIMEFGELFIRPVRFEILAGVILAVIVLFRLDFKNRRSLVWWAIRLVLRLIRERGLLEAIPPHYLDFKVFKMPAAKFAAWQITKVVVGLILFRDLLFGMAVYGTMQGWDLGLGKLWGIFSLPFMTPPLDMTYAQANVIPLVPSLTLIIAPILGAIGLRLMILVGVTQLVRIVTPGVEELGGERQQTGWRIAVIEGLIALGLFWAMINSFFPSYIDYNSKIGIAALLALGVLFSVLAYLDWAKGKGLSVVLRRRMLRRIVVVFIIVLLAGSIMAVQNSIADARKEEWLGPYRVQQIAVNRYLAQLDKVNELPYNFSVKPVPAQQINSYTEANQDILSRVRLWDWSAAFAKLKPEIGLIPYLDFQDSDILRFNQSLYWSASMKPILPEAVATADIWYNTHFVYSHIPSGYLILDANAGSITDTDLFFNQRQVYYGEGGLLDEAWATYPVGREETTEIGGTFYSGEGGLEVPPPLSWIFDSNFFWAYRDNAMHVLRYRDVYERMQLLFPYFEYEFYDRLEQQTEPVDMLPVTDGVNTFWLMPLIVRLDAGHVPWSVGNPVMRLVGYAIIDIYSGSIQLVILGDDYFSELFKKTYSEYVITDIPELLRDQLRYPEELFEWRIDMYNYYHVTDAETFIEANEFFEVPQGLDTYFIMAKPPTIKKPEYIGLLSLELRGAGGRNLAGYMVVRNEYEGFGELIFYEVDIASPTKLLGPTAVVEALEKDSQYAQLKTLLREPRIGDKIFYRIGDHDVYFLPVYTAGAGGVITEMGTIAAVGATFTGKIPVGLGKSVDEAFRSYLAQLVGEEPPPVVVVGLEERKQNIIEYFQERNLSVVQPKATNPNISFLEGNLTYVSEDQWNTAKKILDSFIEKWGGETDKVLMWSEDSTFNFGLLVNIRGIVELHYITMYLE